MIEAGWGDTPFERRSTNMIRATSGFWSGAAEKMRWNDGDGDAVDVWVESGRRRLRLQRSSDEREREMASIDEKILRKLGVLGLLTLEMNSKSLSKEAVFRSQQNAALLEWWRVRGGR